MQLRKKLQGWVAAMVFTAASGGMLMSVALPQATHAACNDRLLTFPAWYRGLTDGKCDIKSPNDAGGLSPFIWKIALNVLELMLQLAGYIAVGFIIRGGFKYMTSIGDPSEMALAKKIIMDAVIGLLLSILSVAIVNLIAGVF